MTTVASIFAVLPDAAWWLVAAGVAGTLAALAWGAWTARDPLADLDHSRLD